MNLDDVSAGLQDGSLRIVHGTPDVELARRYFEDNMRASHERSGVPEDGINYLRRSYVEGAIRNLVAMRQIREHYNDPAILIVKNAD